MNDQIYNAILNLLRGGGTDIATALQEIIRLDEINPLESSIISGFSPSGRAFKRRHVKGQRLSEFVEIGLVEIIWQYNGEEAYWLKYPLEAKTALEKYTNGDIAVPTKWPETKATKIELPTDMFDCIVGYADVKELIKMALTNTKPYNILMVGPPASAKSLFLLEISRLPNAVYALGSSSSKAGLATLLIEKMPTYLIIDELDKMSREDYGVLLSVTETGMVVETKYRKTRSIQLTVWAFAACNEIAGIPKEVISRFEVIYFKPYDKKEFLKTGTKVLVEREDVPKQLASYIAIKIWNEGNKDIRQVIRTGRICKSKAEVNKVIRILKRRRRENDAIN